MLHQLSKSAQTVLASFAFQISFSFTKLSLFHTVMLRYGKIAIYETNKVVNMIQAYLFMKHQYEKIDVEYIDNN
jgi:hypothetical protein